MLRPDTADERLLHVASRPLLARVSGFSGPAAKGEMVENEVVGSPSGGGPTKADEPHSDVLVVDDDPKNLLAVEVALGEIGERIVKASSGPEALKCILKHDFSVVLLDVQMPGMDGFETARLIRSRPRTQHLPIIFLTAFSQSDKDIRAGYRLGAVDYLFKPLVPEILRAKVQVFVELRERADEIRRQGDRLRELERQEGERRLAESEREWEANLLRQKMEEHRLRNEQLAETDRKKDEFIALLAHELRNPLAPLVTGVELLQNPNLPAKSLETIRGAMGRQVQHLTRLVDDLLDISRITSGKIELRREPMWLDDAVQRAIEANQPSMESEGHQLDVERPDERVPVEGDLVRLTQVISNLLSNAIRYTPKGGDLKLAYRREGDEAVVEVTDNGRGIPKEMLDRIFEMFVQERDGGRGLGLGLTLVEQLVRMHDGKVVAESSGVGEGSTFRVLLPVGGAAKPEVSEEAPTEDAGPLRVVLVDDEDDVRLSHKSLLESWGHEVQDANTAESGFELILSSEPDIALLDIGLPGMSGLDLAKRICSAMKDKRPRLVAVSGFGQPADHDRSLAAGCDAHLTKPARPSALRAILSARRSDEN